MARLTTRSIKSGRATAEQGSRATQIRPKHWHRITGRSERVPLGSSRSCVPVRSDILLAPERSQNSLSGHTLRSGPSLRVSLGGHALRSDPRWARPGVQRSSEERGGAQAALGVVLRAQRRRGVRPRARARGPVGSRSPGSARRPPAGRGTRGPPARSAAPRGDRTSRTGRRLRARSNAVNGPASSPQRTQPSRYGWNPSRLEQLPEERRGDDRGRPRVRACAARRRASGTAREPAPAPGRPGRRPRASAPRG